MHVPKRKRHLTIHLIPDYLKDNEFVVWGWRPELSVRYAALSLFNWHNESINIWTHAIGTCLFVALLIRSPTWPIAIYRTGVVFVLSCSTLYHLFHCVSFAVYNTLRKLDFIGIIVSMWAMFWPMIWAAWWSHMWLCGLYIGVASIVSCASICVALSPTFQTNRFHIMRVCTFAMNGLWGIVALLHIYIRVHHMRDNCSIALAAIASFTVGALFYALKFPERFFKIKMFSYLQSHSFFHVFVVFGFVIYNQALFIPMHK